MTTQPTPAVSPRPAQRARNVTFMVTVSVLSALVMLVFLPGYMESRLSVTRLLVVERGGSLTQGLVALRWDGCCEASNRTRTTSCERAYVLAA